MVTGNTAIDVAILLSFVSVVISLLGLILNAKKQHKADIESQVKAQESENQRQLKMTENFVKVNMKLDAFCDTMNQMVIKSDKTNEELRRISDRLIEDKLKIDDHEKRITDLEVKLHE